MRLKIKKVDIAIFGGGLCGFSTALNIKGKKILIVEHRPTLGWEITSSFNCELNKNELSRTSPFKQILKKLKYLGGIRNNRIDPPITEILLNRIAEENKIDILLYSYPLELITEDDLVTGVVIGNKSGEGIIQAKIFVDATESASLWKQTDVEFIETTSFPAKQTIFFNGLEKEIKLPLHLKPPTGMKNISIQPSVWPREVCVEYTIQNNSVSSARLAIAEVISFIRTNVPQLKDVIMTHAGFELFPLDTERYLKEKTLIHKRYKNLFAAGIWTIPDSVERQSSNTLAGRIKLGEETALLLKKSKSPMPRNITTTPKRKYFANFHTSDVIVCGGGTAGSLGAISAAKQTAKVLLIEQSTMLGGIGTGGLMHSYCYGVPGGLQDKIDERVAKLTPLFSGKYKCDGFHPEAKKYVLEKMCKEVGVKIIYNAQVIGIKMIGKHVKGVEVATPSGRISCEGKVVIDSTGDADVATMAGAPYIIGRESDGLAHTYSQPVEILYEGTNVRFINFDAGYADSFDVDDLTRARRAGINQYWRKRFDVQSRLLCIAPIIGIRQSRQIIGDYQLTMKDEIFARKFKDGISFMKANYDNHFVDMENQNDEALLWVWILGNWGRVIGCEIPYRCLLPKNVEGLIVACRGVSMTTEAHYAFRMQRDIQRLGEVAGIAAGLCAKLNTTPRRLNVKLLQKELKKTGALDEKYRPKSDIKERSLKELKKMLVSDNPKDAVWLLANCKKEEVVPILKEILNSGPEESKFWSAVVLAMHKSKHAVKELISCVDKRWNITPEGIRTVPRWKSAIVLLGRIGDRRAVPVLLDVLSDSSVDIDTLIATVRALGRINDKSAISGLLNLLKRKDLPRSRKFPVPWDKLEPIEVDASWQIELAIAESLAKLGKPVNKIIKKYLNDPRSYIRRYAQKIKKSLK